MKKLCLSVFIICFSLLSVFTGVQAELIGGVEFPNGKISFADVVVDFLPGSYVGYQFTDTSAALGIPNYQGIDDGSAFVSLGNGGTLILRFSDNSLTTSGNTDNDLWIFEIGAGVEATDVYIGKDGENWIYVGYAGGSTGGIDIDSYVGKGVIAGEQYFFVKLIDVSDDKFDSGVTAGADIDAVGAISSTVIDTCEDSDNDGVPDLWDTCIDTAAGSWVNRNGCPASGLYTQEQVNSIISAVLLWGDIDGDKKISLPEAIHALQVTSGITKPAIK